MSRYYLHLRHFSGDLVEDEEGSEFPSVSAARDCALSSVRELVGESIKHGQEVFVESIVVTDASGNEVASVPTPAALPESVLKVLKSPVEVVPTNRLQEYRGNADLCQKMAENAGEVDDKVSWLKLANAWLQMLPAHSTTGHSPEWPKSTDEDSHASH